jgi:hypothetical protein
LGKIYDPLEIEKKKREPEFAREYEGKYLGRIGNIFSSSQIDLCQQLGEEYDTTKIPVSLYTLKSTGVDFGFSTSETAIVTLEHIKVGNDNRHIIRVIEAESIPKGDPNKIVELCWSLWKQWGYMNQIFYCDGSNRALINLLKIRWKSL